MSEAAAVERLDGVLARLRAECPWNAAQTHRSLVTYLIEETAEVVEAIEAGDDALLREELGDLLYQVVFHARIAEEQGRFTFDDVAAAEADKQIARHRYVFAGESRPGDIEAAWEHAKRAEKGRRSALDGVPVPLSALARAAKVINRAERLGVLPAGLSREPIAADQVGEELVQLVARAQATGVDVEQALRDRLRRLEAAIVEGESQA